MTAFSLAGGGFREYEHVMTLFRTMVMGWLLLICACTQYEGSDMTEQQHPTLVKARELVQQQEVDEAEELLLKFLRKNPDFAIPHLRLGMIYQTKMEPIKAIYHFERYMEIRPDSGAKEIRQVVEDERRLLSVSVAAAAPGSEQAQIQELTRKLAGAEQELARAEINLQQQLLNRPGTSRETPPEWAREKLELMEEIERLKHNSNSTTASTGSSRSADTSASAVAEPKTYTVQRGDTLSGISQKQYGRASNWQKIYEANQTRIPNKNVLSPGVVLVIPE
jgi:LysM repeat protein